MTDEPRALDPQAAGHPSPADGMARLWAPWRFGYVSEAARKDETSSSDDGSCPFCALPARGEAHDRASLILHRGEHAFVICNAYPYNPGHLMVIPYAHVADLEDLDDATSAEVWELSRRSVVALKERLGCQGVNLGANLGRAAGAGIAPHLHLHAVPRWTGDTNFISVAGAARVLPVALDEVFEQLDGAWD